MAKLNVPRQTIYTYEGAVASHINPELQLRRSVLSCMLWENTFYEDGQSIAQRIIETVPKVSPEKVQSLAIEARTKMKLRHVPLLLARAMAALPTHRHLVSDTLSEIIQRPDELSEFLAIYWNNNPNKKVISAQIKKGLAKAFTKFNEYQLAKWNRDGAIKLRDVLFLCHAKPNSPDQAALWKRLINNELTTPDTWEVELSASKDKKSSWERLLIENKLGALALLRNIRNIQEAGVEIELLRAALTKLNPERVLPFRFISASRFAPVLEPELEVAMFKCLNGKEKIPGKTVLLVDVSGSMNEQLSAKSQMLRIDAACGLAVLARELCQEVEIYTFSNSCVQVPNRRGFSLRDAIINSQPHSGTNLGHAISALDKTKFNRIIVFTDEQSHDSVSAPPAPGYIINVATYKNGVGYGNWTHIGGFSEAVLDYILESEKLTKTNFANEMLGYIAGREGSSLTNFE